MSYVGFSTNVGQIHPLIEPNLSFGWRLRNILVGVLVQVKQWQTISVKAAGKTTKAMKHMICLK